jgi:hypothetical protein
MSRLRISQDTMVSATLWRTANRESMRAEYLINWQTVAAPGIEGVALHPKFYGPFVKGHRAPLMREADVVAPVPLLVTLGSPPAIIRAVGTIIIDAVNAVLGRRTWSHVSVELLKRRPLRTHSDASSAVPVVVRPLRIRAPLPHRHPDDVFGCASHTVLDQLGIDAPAAAIRSLPVPNLISARKELTPTVGARGRRGTLLGHRTHLRCQTPGATNTPGSLHVHNFITPDQIGTR